MLRYLLMPRPEPIDGFELKHHDSNDTSSYGRFAVNDAQEVAANRPFQLSRHVATWCVCDAHWGGDTRRNHLRHACWFDNSGLYIKPLQKTQT